MKIAVGIIGIFLSLIVLMQSCTITGLSGLTEDELTGQAGAVGMLSALLMFFGGAFAFGLPRVAQFVFLASFLVSIPARKEFPDMFIWGIASLVLAALLIVAVKKPKEKNVEHEKE